MALQQHQQLLQQRRPTPTYSAPTLKTNNVYLVDPAPPQQRRRASYSDHHIDVNLAAEIGQALVSKIRALQLDLEKHKEKLSNLRADKLAMQRRLNELVDELAAKTEHEDHLNEELLNLEVTRQRLKKQIRNLGHKLARSQLEQARMLREQSLVNQELELSKAVQESREEEERTRVTELQSKLESTQLENKRLSDLLEDRGRHFCAPCSNSSFGKHDDIKQQDECSTLSSSASTDDNEYEQVCVEEEQRMLKLTTAADSPRPKSWACTSRLPPPPSVQQPGNKERVRSMVIGDTQMVYKARVAVGDWMWKYTRNVTGERRHRRFVWIDPDEKILYWRKCSDPKINAKSARLLSFAIQPTAAAPATTNYRSMLQKIIPSFVFQTHQRDIKLQCLVQETFLAWQEALTELFPESTSSMAEFDAAAVQQQKRASLSRLLKQAPSSSLRSIASFYKRNNNAADYSAPIVAVAQSKDNQFDDDCKSNGQIERNVFPPLPSTAKPVLATNAKTAADRRGALRLSDDIKTRRQQQPSSLSHRISSRLLRLSATDEIAVPYDQKVEC